MISIFGLLVGAETSKFMVIFCTVFVRLSAPVRYGFCRMTFFFAIDPEKGKRCALNWLFSNIFFFSFVFRRFIQFRLIARLTIDGDFWVSFIIRIDGVLYATILTLLMSLIY